MTNQRRIESRSHQVFETHLVGWFSDRWLWITFNLCWCECPGSNRDGESPIDFLATSAFAAAEMSVCGLDYPFTIVSLL